MTELYTKEYIASRRRGLTKARLFALLSALIILCACVICCQFVTTRSAFTLYIVVVSLSVVWGWAFLLYMYPKIRLMKAEDAHSRKTIVSEETAYYEGEISVDKAVTQIPGSIRVRDVKLTQDSGSVRLLLKDGFSLPEGARVKLRCAGKYVTAYEVTDDAQVQ